MARLFISHSSRNNDKAIEVRDWLAKNGWDDVFLDLDPERGIVAGQRWKDALQKAAQRCEMVLALISAEWLASPWCKAEIDAARLMGKKVIVALIGIDKAQVPPDLNDEQWIDLTGDADAYTRLREGLRRSGLDPSSFQFEAGRRPYPGFAFLEEKDAAIFFGREAQIVRGLDKIRSLVRAGVDRMLVILGASGSGKSSFFRAGLWPRLKRDDRTWLPLPTIRPERAAISGKYGLVQALQQTMSEAPFADEFRKRGLPRSRAEIQDFIDKTEDGLGKIFTALRDVAQEPGLSGETTPPPTIVLAVDQGEELFNEDGRDEARRFIEILTGTLKADPHTLAILVMRSDSFPQLQTDARLADLPKDTFTLDMMLEGSYRAVIEGPARLVQPKPLEIEAQLTDALLEDVSGQDALPLLAFTLAHLYDNYAAPDNNLKLAHYEKLGRLKGVIETTVREAFEEGVARGELPKDAKAQLALARVAFIPHLARVNPAGQFVRRIATREEIPAEARALIDRFAERRLLIRDRRKIAGEDVEVIEVAHEAMLREWRELHDALLEEREFLVAKGQLEQDVAEWRAAPDKLKSGALLADNKLLRAREWLVKRPQDLSVEERQFIQASVDKDSKRRQLIIGTAVAAFVVILGFAVFAELKREVAEEASKVAEDARKTAVANESAALAAESAALTALSRIAFEEARPNDAVQLALAAWPRDDRDRRPRLETTLRNLVSAMSAEGLYLHEWGHDGPVTGAFVTKDERRILSWSGSTVGPSDTTVRLWDAETGQQIGPPTRHHGPPSGLLMQDDRRILSWSGNTVRLWDFVTGQQIGSDMKHFTEVHGALATKDGQRILSWSGVPSGVTDNSLRLWEAATGQQIGPAMEYGTPVKGALLTQDERRILSWSDYRIRWFDPATGLRIGPDMEHRGLNGALLTQDERRILSWGGSFCDTSDTTVRLWDAATGQQIGPAIRHNALVYGALLTQDERRILSWSGYDSDGTVRLSDAATGQQIGPDMKHGATVKGALLTQDERRILSWSDDGCACRKSNPNILVVQPAQDRAAKNGPG